ncbi:hypothetical protein GTQ34_14025 [Muricauda sp. JGD-17]|uniref:Uncharacterized protein n=1 Tax=Flagellimonas ochracea TaxID=2696472 RepID=A0A964WYP7_9FLAO|nr:DUF6503 family protein [Allomuricauda ochracea]NAY93038.1 hypothetical protein [Allomuricauda ochracea]
MKTINLSLLTVLSFVLLYSCGERAQNKETAPEPKAKIESKVPIYDTNDPKTILASIEYAHGGWGNLWKKHDVEYEYNYNYPTEGKSDVSIERYIFGTEESFAKYSRHEINVMPNAEGEVIQFFDGNQTVIYHNGKEIQDATHLDMADFLRRTNYYWFTMPYKLNDKAAKAKYLGKEEYNGIAYDKVEVSYDAAITGKEQNDVYIILVNPKTKLIDRFYFSIPFFGVDDPVIAANYEYEKIEGQLIATKRSYFLPSEAGYPEEPGTVQTLTKIKFNNGFTVDNIME